MRDETARYQALQLDVNCPTQCCELKYINYRKIQQADAGSEWAAYHMAPCPSMTFPLSGIFSEPSQRESVFSEHAAGALLC